jgi:hypothetical protein
MLERKQNEQHLKYVFFVRGAVLHIYVCHVRKIYLKIEQPNYN